MDSLLQIRTLDVYEHKQTEALLSDKSIFRVGEIGHEEWSFYDTFDWRITKNSQVLYSRGNEFTWLNTGKGEENSVRIGDSSPVFVWDIPEGSMRRGLLPVLEERALLDVAHIQIQSSTYRILNKDDKTIARLIYTAAYVLSGHTASPLSGYLSLQPVRGYDKAAKKLAQHLDYGNPVDSLVEDVYLRVLDVVGYGTGGYSNKLDLRLEPNMRSDGATNTIMLRLLEVIRANEDGIRNDIDTEFLHDYRVAIRKTRSALSQIKNVFPDDVTTHFKHEFRQLGQRTNQLRDLDVYLLAEPEYRAMLPDALQDSVTPLFEHLRSQRSEALGDVINGLDLEGYELTLLEWESFLTESIAPSAAGVNAGVPIIDLARQQIYRRYRRIIKRGNRLLKRTEDVKLHALRIECKKLRYLLEFFASLFPSKKVNRLIRQLKRVQENLGDFTDLSVQQEHLLTVAGELPIEDPQTRRALVATSVLVDALASKQKEVKGDFAKTFSKFASPANQKAYHKLFDHEVTRRTL